MGPSSRLAEYCLIQEQHLLQEVNKILTLAGDESHVVINDPIECEF